MAYPARKYNKKLHGVIVQSVRNGHPKMIAFRAAGVHPQTVIDWVAMGRAQPDTYPEYVQLAEDIEQAKAEAEMEALDRIKAAAKADHKHWTADAWYLERTNPEQFSRRDRVEIETGSQPLIQLNQLVLMDEDVREQSRALLRKVAAPLPRPSGSSVDVGADVIAVSFEEVDEDG